MSKNQGEKRLDIRENLDTLGREMSTKTILFHEAIAEKAGLSGTDHKFIDLFLQHGSMTAGQLAQLSGLTTGAITGVIDRLERKGLVQRQKNPNDRRQVLVVLNKDEVFKKIGPAFAHMKEGLNDLYSNFSADELKLIERYLMKTIEFYERQIEQLKKG